MKLRRTIKRTLIASTVLIILSIVAGLLASHFVPLPERLGYDDSLVATYHDGTAAHVLLSEDDRWRLPTRIDDVDPAYIDALLALEDKRFYSHLGVDFIAILRATIDNLRASSIVSGASTITMQLVRLLEPRPRTFRSKAVEALRALQLERHLSKQEILEAYMRFTPYGGNLEGIEAAALSYWGRQPSGLTTPEIATLLAIPQSPVARRPAPENRERLSAARDEIAWRLASEGAVPMAARPDELAAMLAATHVPTEAYGLPREIPHLMGWLKSQRPDASRIHTTLDRAVQRRIARITADYRLRLRATGAPHAAVVVLESDTGRVRGIVGNITFDATPGSHLPAFTTPRSTGSLLKPVVYAAALDEGLLATSHMRADVPTARGDYRPQNFDRQFQGLVEAEEALARSLNIPFIRLLEELSVDEFVQTLARFGLLAPVRRAGDGGLELVVGGMPATPLEVASLYAGFARQGLPVTPIIYNDKANPEPRPQHERAVSQPAAWLTSRGLTRRAHPWAELGPRHHRDEAFVWKTGTSYSYHDAWTAGFGAQYTLAVWAGDLSYERHPQLIGAHVAAPLFFEIIDAIDQPYPLRAQKPHDELATIDICSRSGRRPGPHCPHITHTEAPALSAAPARCEFHVQIDIDRSSGHHLPEGCRPAGVTEVETRIVERLPDPVARFERSRGRRAGSFPPTHPDCTATGDRTLSITSPRDETTVVLEHTRPADRQLVRLEAYSPTGSQVHWYIDGRHIESAGPEEAVYWIPEPGNWTIAAVDDRGDRHIRTLSVTGHAAPPNPDE